MATIISQNTRSRYLQISILVFLVAICIFFMLNYVNRMEATLEQFRFKTSLSNLQRVIILQQLARNTGDLQCTILNNSDLFMSALWSSPKLTASKLFAQTKIPSWSYDNVQHQLTYQVHAVDYFWSPLGPKITIDFQCEQGTITLKVSPYHWCLDWQIRDCNMD